MRNLNGKMLSSSLLPRDAQKLWRRAFPEWRFTSGGALTRKMRTKTELVDLGPSLGRTVERSEVAQAQRQGLWSIGAGDFAGANKSVSGATVAAPFVFLKHDAETVCLRHLQGKRELCIRGAAIERVSDFACPDFTMREIAGAHLIPVAQTVREIINERARLDREFGIRLFYFSRAR